MSYPSVEKLQQTLAKDVFHYAKDKKKAAGRALGTLVELITYYTLRAWQFRDNIVIERPLPEFANPDITHNVEFTLHPSLASEDFCVPAFKLPLTGRKLHAMSGVAPFYAELERDMVSGTLLASNGTRRNSAIIATADNTLLVANVLDHNASATTIRIAKLHKNPFAAFECKRVGVEEGMKKGPQTIEKAKQGAYVARTVSSLQKIRARDGKAHGYLEKSDGTILTGPLAEVAETIIASSDKDLLKDFILTVGVVSNHGNWFTAENQNKELRVLAQSYDWLLFLTDAGLTQFIDKLLLQPVPELRAARDAFLRSYNTEKKGNCFTKVQIDNEADAALVCYFKDHEAEIESWYNVISPRGETLDKLQAELNALAQKNWTEIHR